MLGIDTAQVGLNWIEEQRRPARLRNNPGGIGAPSLLPPQIVSALELGSLGQGMSRRMKEQQFSQQRNHSSNYNSPGPSQQTPVQLQQIPSYHHNRRPHYSGSHHNYHHHSQAYYNGASGGASGGGGGGHSSSSRMDPHSGRGRTHDRDGDDSNHPLFVNEVRRNKKKLIIQPSSQQTNQHHHHYGGNH